jgi:hypothetical protein
MVALVERIAREGGTTRAAVRKETAKPKAGRPKAYIFSYKVIAALQNIIGELRARNA